MKNKIALITGATSGIGLACAHKFAKENYDIIITGRKEKLLNDIKTEIEKHGVECKTLVFDVRNRQETINVLQSLTEEWCNIDVLINNAGLALGLEKEYEGSFEDWDIMIDTNIKGLLTVTRTIVPEMVKRNKGHIINIGSVAGDGAYPNGNVYCATKAAVKTLSDGLRMDLVETPIRVTNIKPGLVETNFSITRFHGDKEKADGVYKGIKPLTGEDIAESAFYAASAPAHVQVAEILILATHQASGSVVSKDVNRKDV